jgi:hypothetical protein
MTTNYSLSNLRHGLLRASSLMIGLVLLASLRAAATTYAPMTDRDLADRSAVIAVVTVESSSPAPARTIATDYLVQVDQVVKGDLPGSTIAVRVPGGVRADGIGLKIWGAPEFHAGEQALVFLDPNRDGSYTIASLMLGAFHLRAAGDGVLALRDLAEAHPVALKGQAVESEPLRDEERFVSWLADRAAGIVRPADYRIAGDAGLRQTADKYATFTGSDGNSIRWFEFDSGKSVRFFNYAAGQPGLSADATSAAFATAINAWNADPTSTIDYSYGGTTQASGGLHGPDGVNAILFNDPNNDVPGTFDCAAGGIIAQGGPYFDSSTRSYNGKSYHPAIEGDIVTNDGTQCFFQDNPTGAAEVFAHELGHTLGFAHTTDRNALMYAAAHNDGRGALLGTDDRIGASALYGDGSYQGPPPPPPPGPHVTLTAKSTAPNTVTLTWSHNIEKPAGFDVEQQQPDGSFQTLAATAGNAASYVITGLSEKQTFAFRVCGQVTGSADEVVSNLAQVRPQAPAGSHVTLTAASTQPTIVSLKWSHNVKNPTGFQIEVQQPNGSFRALATAGKSALSFEVKGLSASRLYVFRVSANTGAEAQPIYSNQVKIRPKS